MVAEEGANYGQLVITIDGAKQAGAETIGMATQIPTAVPNAQPSPTPPPGTPPAP